jgi:DNA ligase (NAD+)
MTKDTESLKKEIVKELKPFLEKEIQKVVKDKFTDDEIKKVTVKTLSNLIQLNKEELLAIDEVGETIADSILSFFVDYKNQQLLQRLNNAGLQFELSDEQKEAGSNKFIGFTFVISGVFNKYSRDQLKELIELNGGKNSGSISSKTSYVLAGENMGPEKLKKAQSLGVKIISENDFLALLN